MKWLLSIGCGHDDLLFAYTAKMGILKWLLENNFSRHPFTLSYVVKNGNLENIK